MNLNFITRLLLILSLALLAKAGPIEEYPNELEYAEGRVGYNVEFCRKNEYGRFFLDGENFLCLVPYSGSIPKKVEELTEKHLVILNEKIYDLSPNMIHTFKKCDISKKDSDSINECYEEYAEIIGIDVEAIKPKLNLKEAVDSMLQVIKDLCKSEAGLFFFNDDDYICLIKPKKLEVIMDFIGNFIDDFIIYRDEYYTPHKIYTYINYIEFEEYYTKVAKLLNVSIDSLVPYKSFDAAMKKYFEFERERCILYYEKENSFACFGLSVVPYDEDLNMLLNNHRAVIDGEFYYLTKSSFKCERGDFSCYDRIAYVMDVDVDSILPK